jgi:sugar phosphate isomerase/epimerase
VAEGMAALLDDARVRGMPLAIEPLHPMYAADRACINTLEQALDLCDALDPQRSGALGVAVDVYHVWWDPQLRSRSSAPAASGCWRFTSATGSPPPPTCSTTAA